MVVEINPEQKYASYIGIKFDSTAREYFFGVKENQHFSIGDAVIVETVRGMELGFVSNGLLICLHINLN